MDKKLQESASSLDFKLCKHPSSPDLAVHRALSTQPLQRSKEDLSLILRLTKKVALFRQLLQKKAAKYKEVLVNLAPYWELRAFESGDNVTVTGDPSQYFNLLLEGTVHIFVPRNEEAFQTSIRLRNSKRRKRTESLISRHNEKQHQGVAETEQQMLSPEQASGLLVAPLVSPLSPHVFSHTLKEALAINRLPEKFQCPVYHDCIAICSTRVVCLSLRYEIYKDMQEFRKQLKQRLDMKVLLRFFKGLKYEDVGRFLDPQYMVSYEEGESIKVIEKHFYIVLEGEILTMVLPPHDDQQELRMTLEARRQKLLCHSYPGQLIGGERIEGLHFQASQRTRLLQLNQDLLKREREQHPWLDQQIKSVVQTRREFLGTAIGNHNSIKQHDREVQAQDLQASDRRDMEDLLVIEAVKGGSRSVRERIRNSNVEIMRATSRISICVSRKKDKLIRSRKLLEQHTDRDLFTKLGLLNQEQIARHNSELMRKMSVLESSAPTAGLMQNISLPPPQPETTPFHLPQVFSRQASLRSYDLSIRKIIKL